jgi:hypothetical protein
MSAEQLGIPRQASVPALNVAILAGEIAGWLADQGVHAS